MSDKSRRSVAIIGAGIAGSTAGLAFVEAGFDVTIYSDRDRRSLRDDVPPTGAAILFGKSREFDAEIIEDLYSIGNTTGISARLYDGSGASRTPVLEFNPEFGYEAQAVDVRLRADDRLGRFLERGGRLEVGGVDPQRLDSIAAQSDLVLVASGKDGLAKLFAIDESRTHYTEPQRTLLQIVLRGFDQGEDVFGYRNRLGGKHSLFNRDTENGEIWGTPFLHKDEGVTWGFLAFAKPGGAWGAKIAAVRDAETARQTIIDLYRTYFPEDVSTVEQLQIVASDPHSWLKGAVLPTVRKPVATTSGGHVVAAIGDTAIAVDPIAGQGAQNALVQIAELVKAAKSYDGEFTTNWLTAEFEKHWARRGHASVEVTRLFLGDPEYAPHLQVSFPAAAVSESVATALFGLLSDPNPVLALKSQEDVLNLVTAVAGRPAHEVLSDFRAATEFSAAPKAS